MDPFTQRMLERARARQEKIDQKLANSGQSVPKRKPLTENISVPKSDSLTVKSPVKPVRESITSPRKSLKAETPAKIGSRRSSSQKEQALVPAKSRDVIVTKKEFKSPRKGSLTRRNSDVSVEINISHRNDIQIEVQVEERDAPITVVYDSQAEKGSSVVIEEIVDTPKLTDKGMEISANRTEKGGLRQNVKSRLDRLGNLYSDKPELSSPIHRTELEFSSATPPSEFVAKPKVERAQDGKKKFGRLAALADQINTWEDDLSHHNFQPEQPKKTTKEFKKKSEDSTLDVSIHSIKDIDKALKATQSQKTAKQTSKTSNQVNECQRLKQQIVAELEPKLASTTPSAVAAPAMATMVAPPAKPTITKKPSLKKYHAPTPPQDESELEKDKENNVIQKEENDNEIQTKIKPDEKSNNGSPMKRLAPKLNGNVDRSSVLSKAAMFEAGSPRAKEKDPAEMSLRERKALFEKNKGTAIIPKAPFGLAPSTKTLLGENKDKSTRPTVQTAQSITKNSRSNSKDSVAEDSISQSSLGGGIKGKLVALFSKEQTISETSIANKFKLERERDMEMLQNRFPFKQPSQKQDENDSDDDQSEHNPSEKAPLMGSVTSLSTAHKKPEIIANIPKVTFETKPEKEEVDKDGEKDKDDKVGSQPVKRRSSQDSPAVQSIVDDVKRIKVNKTNGHNGVVTQQPSIYPHLSDIETDNSHEEYSDCGGSRCGHYTLECVFFFMCI